MSKTIEELAEQYVKDVYNGDTDFIDETESVLTWLFNKPLAQRLTEAEKIRMRDEYDEARIFSENVDPCGIEYAKNEAGTSLLERIFGKDFFEEDKL